MMKKIKICFAIVLALSVVGACLIPLYAAPADEGTISVNGLLFNEENYPDAHENGTLSEAVAAAMAIGATQAYPVPTVTINGIVKTAPIGHDNVIEEENETYPENGIISNIIIEGDNTDDIEDVLLLEKSSSIEGERAAIQIRGRGVTIQNLTVDAAYNATAAIYIRQRTTDQIIVDPSGTVDADGDVVFEMDCKINNVVAKNATGAGIEIGNAEDIAITNTVSRNNYQAGFMIESCGDNPDITFAGTKTIGNILTGLILKNGFSATTNFDATGLSCLEGSVAFHDLCSANRYDLTFASDEEGAITPLDKDGDRISMDIGINYPLDKKYTHIRFGNTEFISLFAGSCVSGTDRYGASSDIYFFVPALAYNFTIDNESVVTISASQMLMRFITYVMGRFTK